MGYILAADVGGTKLATALLSANGTVLQAAEIRSEKNDGEKLFQSLIDSFKSLCMNTLVQIDEINGIAVGIPGIVDTEKGIAIFQNNLPWRNFLLAERLANEFPKSHIIVDNDVYMAAWGEYTNRGFSQESFVYVTLSTGISCCSIFKGMFLRGAGMAGEIGFNLTDIPGTSFESLVSGPSLEAKGKKLLNSTNLTLKEIMEFYYEGNDSILPIINEAVRTLAKAIYHIIVLEDPHCIVLGGGVFNNHPGLIELVRKEVRQYLHHPLLKGKEERIEASAYKESAGLHGAASRIIGN
jgi:glucokinase